MTYNWQNAEWPNFRYSDAAFQEDLLNYAQLSGQLHGSVWALSEENQNKALLDVLVMEALKTTQIEGELLQRKDVVASVRKSLRIEEGKATLIDLRAKGISE